MPADKARPQPDKLNIGCGRAPKPGFTNCDLYPGPGVDFAFDCQGEWPFADESVSRIESDHTLEHLSDPMAFFREAWRVLIPNGQMQVRLPYGWHQSAWWDLTHLRPWVQESFAILQPGFVHFTRNHQHEDMGFAFWVVQATMIFNMPWARMWRFKPLRPLCRWAGGSLLNVYRDISVEMFKTTKDDRLSQAFGGPRHPAIVPCAYGVLAHEYNGVEPEKLDHYEILVFTTHKGAA